MMAEGKPVDRTKEIEETLNKMRETLGAFDQAGDDLKRDPKAAEVFGNLRREMERLEQNLKLLKAHMEDKYAPKGLTDSSKEDKTMSGSITRVSIEALNKAISDYNARKQEMQVAYLQISNTVRQLNVTWTGSSSKKFADQFDQLYKNLEQTEQQMDSATKKLEQARDLYQQAETEAKSLLQQAEEGTTPSFF